MLCVIIVIFTVIQRKKFPTLYIYINYPIEIGCYNRITATYNLCIGELSVKKLKLKKKFLRKKIRDKEKIKGRMQENLINCLHHSSYCIQEYKSKL